MRPCRALPLAYPKPIGGEEDTGDNRRYALKVLLEIGVCILLVLLEILLILVIVAPGWVARQWRALMAGLRARIARPMRDIRPGDDSRAKRNPAQLGQAR
jgi:hypothetical protein